MRFYSLTLLGCVAAAVATHLVVACSPDVNVPSASSGAASGGGAGGAPAVTVSAAASGSASASSGEPQCDASPDEDLDQDGFTVAEGDCNDCDPHLNPGALEIIGLPSGDGGVPIPVDEDCDGIVDNVLPPCDADLAVGDVDPLHAAQAIELCKTTTASSKEWGLIEARYVAADGTPRAPGPGLQAGLLTHFGANVVPEGGKTMLALSSGRARDLSAAAGEPCGGPSCSAGTDGNAPPGYPITAPNCPTAPDIHDDIGLEVKVRPPSNALGLSFAFKLYSFAFPSWVCTPYNDQFVALLTPPLLGTGKADVVYDVHGNPLSINLASFGVCDPASVGEYAKSCPGPVCPTAPNPYCELGPADLAGTGFDVWGDAGATSWLRTSMPIEKPGSEITLRFAIWDTGDHQRDSTVLIDHVEWITMMPIVDTGKSP